VCRRPSAEAIDAYLAARAGERPTSDGAAGGAGFHHDTVCRILGRGEETYRRACEGLVRWEAHRGAGVEVFPVRASLDVGETVAVLTRQVGVWVLAACRLTAVEHRPDAFGFTFATLTDHPERGIESFIVRRVGEEVRFEIVAVARPGNLLVRAIAPMAVCSSSGRPVHTSTR
jgi:uncharacterized protein (UPF0548 family)